MHFLTPSLLCGGWEVQHALFDRISNTVSSCLVHFMIILVVFLAVIMRVLNLPAPAQEGWGQKVLAQPPSPRPGGTGSKSACSTSSFAGIPHSRGVGG